VPAQHTTQTPEHGLGDHAFPVAAARAWNSTVFCQR